MKRKAEIILVATLLIIAVLWRLVFWSEGVYGSDIFYHYTVVEQALKNNELSNDNNLAVCFEGAKTGHPIGFYIVPYSIAKIVGLDAAFIITPILLGILGLLIWYIFLRLTFNTEIALWTLGFLAITLAHVSKSFPFSHRGENIVLPFFFLSLIGLHKMLIEKKGRYSILAGVSSGVTCFLWNGYPLIIIIYLATIMLYLLYSVMKKEKSLGQNIKHIAISLLVQAFVIVMVFLTTELSGKGLMFSEVHYPVLLLAAFIGLGTLFIAYKKNSYLPLIGAIIVIGIGAFYFMDHVLELARGFGSIKIGGLKTGELYNTQWHQYFFGLHILGVLAIPGMYTFFKRFDKRSVLFLGVLLSSLYLVFSASRYIYFSSFALVTLASLFLSNKKIVGKKIDIFIVLSITTLLVVFIYSLYAIPLYFAQSRFVPDTEPFLFLKENTPSDACVIHTGERGAAIEYFTKRYYYLHSLGNVPDREERVALFLLDNNTKHLEKQVTHIFLYYPDLIMMNRLNIKANMSDIGYLRIFTNEEDVESEEKIVENLKFMQTVHINGKTVINETGIGCYFQYKGDEFYIKSGVCNTNLYKMITNQTIKGLKNIYYKDGYSIYEVESTKNLEKRE